MIKTLYVFDFDGTLYDSELPETGKLKWEKITGEKYPHLGWWGRPESLDVNIFKNKPFEKVLNILNNANNDPESYVIILTSRLERLRPYLNKVLVVNNINVDEVSMKNDNRDKGQKVLDKIKNFPDLNVVNVYDDRDVDIQAYKRILPEIDNKIQFNIFLATEGLLTLVDSNTKTVNEIVVEEILSSIKKM